MNNADAKVAMVIVLPTFCMFAKHFSHVQCAIGCTHYRVSGHRILTESM